MKIEFMDTAKVCKFAVSGLVALLTTLMIAGCSTEIPKGMSAVTPFNIDQYIGRWYEIARLDHSFERGLTDVTATYKLNTDGSVEVINRGFDPKKNDFKQASGKAYFTGDKNTGSLKVSFFGPFYGGYHVIALDQSTYAWAMVAGPDRDYLWILAREPKLNQEVRDSLLSKARELGFDTAKLIWVDQSKS